MRLSPPNGNGTGFTTLASFVIVAAVLFFAKEVFIPIALASLLSFLLAPLVVRLSRLGLGKVMSVVLVVALATGVLAVIGWLVMAQVVHLADQLPLYQQNLHSKVQALRRPNQQGVLARASGVVKELQNELDSLSRDEGGGGGQNVESPLPVEIKRPKPTPLEVINNVVGPVLKPLATAGAVVFFVILMLFQREDLRDRFLKLVSRGELSVATQAVDDAAQRVSRYLLMQLIVNATYGLPIGIGLYFIGVPNAFLWGLLATLLRFIPFLGPWIAASFPLVLAFAVDPGWTKSMLTLGLFLFVELVSNNIIEPWLYGASTGVSNFALLVAAIFWTWLWGAVGLLLSTPLTVCLLVLGKYVPGLNFLSVLLGSDPVLEPHARFYQRMLAMEEDELYTLSQRVVRERSLPELYDSIIVPALSLAEQDRHKGALTEARQAFILQSTRELVESLGPAESDDSTVTGAVHDSADPSSAPPILCIPARDEADELAALMLAQMLGMKGIAARVLSAKALTSEWLKQIRTDQTAIACVSGIPPFAVTPARQICCRLKQEVPNLKVVAGIWNAKAPLTEVAGRLGSSCPDALVSRLSDAVTRLETLLESEKVARQRAAARPSTAPVVPPAPATPPAEAEPEEIFALITRQAAKLLNVPVSMVTLIETDADFWKAHGGVPPDLMAGEALRESLLQMTSTSPDHVLEISDLAADSRFSSNALLKERGIRFISGVPLRTSDGHLVGTLCVADTQPHQTSERANTLLKSLGERLVQEVESRGPANSEPSPGIHSAAVRAETDLPLEPVGAAPSD